mmetsp:Transcript_2672/g.3866  ORF Transcript_2672/g.3866 Transcript_2672/m.3866 type:complete len:437 (+) Transcript_2672:136-1446(+)
MAASHAATARFWARLGNQLGKKVHESNIRKLGPLSVSAVGFGGYRATIDDAKHIKALIKAIEGGVNLIDTAPTYKNGASEVLIGSVLNLLAEQKRLERDEVVIMTKAGYIEGPELELARKSPPEEYLELSPDSWHCIHPDYIEQQVEASTRRLGTIPDIVLLHSPEFFISNPPHGTAGGRGLEGIHDAFYERVERAFVRLEKMIDEGKVGHYYGVSSSLQGCDYSVTGRNNAAEGPSLRRLLDHAELAAKKVTKSNDIPVSPSHRFKVAQIPLNLIESGPSVQCLLDPESENMISTLEAAEKNDVFVVTNRPINAIAPEGIGAGDWGRQSSYFKLADKLPMSPELSLMRQAIHTALKGECGDVYQCERLALWLASSARGVGATLCGATSEKYIDDILEVLHHERLKPQGCQDAFDAVDSLMCELSPTYALNRSRGM